MNKRRKIDPVTVTVQDVVNATVNEHSVRSKISISIVPFEFFYFWKQVIQRFSGEHIAPPWFAAAMAVALAPIEARTILTEARVFNALATREEDIIKAPIIPPLVAAPVGFPATVLALRSLSNNNCNVVRWGLQR